MIEIVVATTNKGKLKEIRQALSDVPVKILALSDFPDIPEVIEDGTTFFENALKKAETIAKHTDKFALADDSGLVVDALKGAPGVYSARYAGEDANDDKNNQKLLQELEKLGGGPRTARFVAVIVLCSPDGEHISAEGTCEGEIMKNARGEAGFGYDPLFYYPAYEKTFSEISREDKLKVSHRGKALVELETKMSKWIYKDTD